jgi:hypothetical protein
MKNENFPNIEKIVKKLKTFFSFFETLKLTNSPKIGEKFKEVRKSLQSSAGYLDNLKPPVGPVESNVIKNLISPITDAIAILEDVIKKELGFGVHKNTKKLKPFKLFGFFNFSFKSIVEFIVGSSVTTYLAKSGVLNWIGQHILSNLVLPSALVHMLAPFGITGAALGLAGAAIPVAVFLVSALAAKFFPGFVTDFVLPSIFKGFNKHIIKKIIDPEKIIKKLENNNKKNFFDKILLKFLNSSSKKPTETDEINEIDDFYIFDALNEHFEKFKNHLKTIEEYLTKTPRYNNQKILNDAEIHAKITSVENMGPSNQNDPSGFNKKATINFKIEKTELGTNQLNNSDIQNADIIKLPSSSNSSTKNSSPPFSPLSGGGFLNTPFPAYAGGTITNNNYITPGIYDNPTRGNLTPGQAVIPLNRNVGKNVLGGGLSDIRHLRDYDQPMIDVMSQPLRAIGLAAIATIGNFISALGPLGGFFIPYATGIIKDFAKILGVPFNYVSTLILGPAYAANNDLTSQQNVFAEIWNDVMKNFGINIFGSSSNEKNKTNKTNNNNNIPLTGNTNAEKAYNFFIQKGLSPEASAGIVGNLLDESGTLGKNIPGLEKGDLNTGENQSDGKSKYWGIANWAYKDGRRETYINGGTVNGKVWKGVGENGVNDLNNQLEYIWWELDSGSNVDNISSNGHLLDQIKSAKTASEAAKIFDEGFERSSAGREERQNFAEEFLKLVQNKQNVSAESGINFGSGNILGSSVFHGPNSGYNVSDNVKMHGTEILMPQKNGFSIFPIENNKYSLSKDPINTLQRWQSIMSGGSSNKTSFADGGTVTVSSSQETFYKNIYSQLKSLGATDVQAQLGAVQASYESGYGTSVAAKKNHNLFGQMSSETQLKNYKSDNDSISFWYNHWGKQIPANATFSTALNNVVSRKYNEEPKYIGDVLSVAKSVGVDVGSVDSTGIPVETNKTSSDPFNIIDTAIKDLEFNTVLLANSFSGKPITKEEYDKLKTQIYSGTAPIGVNKKTQTSQNSISNLTGRGNGGDKNIGYPVASVDYSNSYSFNLLNNNRGYIKEYVQILTTGANC